MAYHRLNRAHIEQFYENNVFLPSRIIYIGDQNEDGICGLSSANVIKGLYLLKSICRKKQITVIVNTKGGDEYEAWAIYDAMKNLHVPIKTITYGSCMSAGTIIFLGGEQRYIGQNCVFMLHDGTECQEGHQKNLERWAEFGKKYRSYSYRIYYDAIKEKKKQITMKTIEEMCTLDTILTAHEAVEWGFAHKILK